MLIGLALGLDTFKRHMGEMILAMSCFAIPYIQLNYLFSYPIAWCYGKSTKGTDEVFKYVLLPNMILYALGLYLTLSAGSN
jgi:hypothetical protein